jgi:hypothetical protein
MTITHQKKIIGPDDPSYQVSSSVWNNDPHIIQNNSIPLNKLAVSGTPNASTVLYGDGTWKPAASSTGARAHYQYLIYLDGQTCTAINSTGAVIASGTNHSTVIQYVVDMNPSGIVAFGPGTFDVSDSSIKLQSDRSYTFRGSGSSNNHAYYEGTILNAGNAPDAKVFEIVDCGGPYNWFERKVSISDITLMAVYGYGLHCDFPAHHSPNGGQVSPRFTLNNMYIAAKYGMKINQLSYSFFSNIRIFSENVVGPIGIWLIDTNTNGYHSGNSTFIGVQIQSWSGTGHGVFFDGESSTSGSWINMIKFFHLEIIGNGDVGVYMKTTRSNSGMISLIDFYGTTIEGYLNAVAIYAKNNASPNIPSPINLDTGDTYTSGKVAHIKFNDLFTNAKGNEIGTDIVMYGVNAFYNIKFNSPIVEGRIYLGGVDGSGWGEMPAVIVEDQISYKKLVPPVEGTPFVLRGSGNGVSGE